MNEFMTSEVQMWHLATLVAMLVGLKLGKLIANYLWPKPEPRWVTDIELDKQVGYAWQMLKQLDDRVYKLENAAWTRWIIRKFVLK